MTAGLVYHRGDDLAALASNLNLVDFDTGAVTTWQVTPAQRRIWNAGWDFQFRFIAKPRRIYASTACDLEDALWTAANDANKQRVRCGVFLDKEGTDGVKIRERVQTMSWFLTQQGLKHEVNNHRITFPYAGSEIIVATAGGDRAAASIGLQRVRLEEFSYYGDAGAIASILGAAAKQASVTIVTTVDITADNGQQARHYWRDPKNGFEKLFFCVMDHPEYRGDPAELADDEWKWAVTEGGFPDDDEGRRGAAYWFRALRDVKCSGDMARAMHEYPQVPEHMFAAGTGRWVPKTSRVLEPLDVWKVLGLNGSDVWPIFVWRRPSECGGRVVLAADSAKGAGVSRSTVVGVDESDGRVVCTFSDATIMGDDHALVAQRCWQQYSATRADGRGFDRPRLRAEDNTTGQIFIQPAKRLGLPVETFDTTEASQMLGMQEARRAIMAGLFEGPKELAEECDECIRDPLTGRWKGHKDLMMTYGMCTRDLVRKPFGPPKDTRVEHRIDGRRMILQAQRIERMRRGI